MTQRIVIFGNSGSGKTTLASQLARDLNIEHVDLDVYAWLPAEGSQPPTRAPLEQTKLKLSHLLSNDKQWVIEGCYADILSLVLPAATTLYFMDIPIEQCVLNAKSRPWEPHKYPTKEAQDKNLAMLIKWIEDYQVRTDEFSYQAHQALFDSFDNEKHLVSANRAINT